MELNVLNQTMTTIKKGAYTKATWQSYPLKSGAYKDRIRKVTNGIVRVGIEFSHLSENKGRTTGALSYGTWHKKNYVIENVNKDKVVSYLVRLYPSKCKNHRSEITWYFDDKIVSSEWLIENGYAKKEQLFKSSNEPLLCFNVGLQNLISLG